MTAEQLTKTLASAVAGMLLGWAGSALTLTGRVDAIEHSVARIEAHIDRISVQQPRKETP